MPKSLEWYISAFAIEILEICHLFPTYCASTRCSLVKGRPYEVAHCVILRRTWLLWAPCGRAWIPCSQTSRGATWRSHTLLSTYTQVMTTLLHWRHYIFLLHQTFRAPRCCVGRLRTAIVGLMRVKDSSDSGSLRIHGLLTRRVTVRIWARILFPPRYRTDCGLTAKLKRGTNCWIRDSYRDHRLLGRDTVSWFLISTWLTLRTWR
jgi:hypothetical protein